MRRKDSRDEPLAARISRLAIPIAILSALIGLPGCATSRSDPSAAIDRIVQSRHERGRFSGTALVAFRDGVVYERAVGFADESWAVSNTPDTRFQIGSLTKQFTAALILDLQRQGKIDLDAPIHRYLPEYRPDIGQSAKIRDLLGHTAGIPDFVRRPDILDVVMRAVTPSQLVSTYCSGAPEFAPGSTFRYSNCGYLILGAIYERISGQTYGEGLAALVSRAGLKDTGVAGPRDLVPRLATGYIQDKGAWKKAPYIDWSIAFSSGSVYSTGNDLWRWLRGLRGGTTLGEKAPAEIFTVRPFGYSFGWHVGRTDRAHLKGFLASDYDVSQPSPDMAIRLASHSGDLPGFHSCMATLLDGTWTVILLDNHDSTTLTAMAAEILSAVIP